MLYLCMYRFVRLKPGSYFMQMRMRSEFDVNLTSQPSFRSDIRKWVEQSCPAANFSLRICDVNIRIAFAFTESMNQALVGTYWHSLLGWNNVNWEIFVDVRSLSR